MLGDSAASFLWQSTRCIVIWDLYEQMLAVVHALLFDLPPSSLSSPVSCCPSAANLHPPMNKA